MRNREGDAAVKVLGVLDFYSRQHVEMRAKIVPDITLVDDYVLDNASEEIAKHGA